MPKQFPIVALESDIVVPLSPPHTKMPLMPKRDTELNLNMTIEFPERCAWCDSPAVIQQRQVQISAANPAYMTYGNRLAGEALSLVVGAAIAGGGTSGQGYIYSGMRPGDIQKIKGMVLTLTVPCCADHTASPAADAFQLVDIGLGKGACLIRVHSQEYAQSIGNHYYNKMVRKVDEHTLIVPDLEAVIWPERCVVCGLPDPGVKGKIVVSGLSTKNVEVPFCPEHLADFKNKEQAVGKSVLIGFLLGIGAGLLTLLFKMSTLAHIALCTGAGLVVALAVYMLIGTLYYAPRIGFDPLTAKAPVEISPKDTSFQIKLQNADIAEALRKQVETLKKPE
ncbi:MAG: hypothetical protein K8I82_15690 [Anaerolineae bacterium]|nr:hypothetical protein [Anaerolineae bacterium]